MFVNLASTGELLDKAKKRVLPDGSTSTSKTRSSAQQMWQAQRKLSRMSPASEFAAVIRPSNGTKTENAVNITEMLSRHDCVALWMGAREEGFR